MEQEIWKYIEGFENYQISSYGMAKSLKNNKESILNQNKDTHGYYKVILSKNNKKYNFYIHRLVAKAFIPNPENKPQINHIDGIKTNNHISNLEWCTASENLKHAYKTGLKENVRTAAKKNAIIAQESRKKTIYSKKLDLKFDSIVDAANYIQSNYFENIKLNCLKTSISDLLKGRKQTSRYDFSWSYVK